MNLQGLGTKFDVIPVAKGAWIDLSNATGVTLICSGADTFTLKSGQGSSGTGNANLPIIKQFYPNTASAGATQWTKSTQTAAATLVLASGIAAVEVNCESLPDAHDRVQVTSAGAGTVLAILHGLELQRSPELLAAPAA